MSFFARLACLTRFTCVGHLYRNSLSGRGERNDMMLAHNMDARAVSEQVEVDKFCTSALYQMCLGLGSIHFHETFRNCAYFQAYVMISAHGQVQDRIRVYCSTLTTLLVQKSLSTGQFVRDVMQCIKSPISCIQFICYQAWVAACLHPMYLR